jgi:putative metalloprotease
MITKILPIVVLISVFYIGSIYSSKNLSKKLEEKSKIFHDPVIDNYLKAFQSILALGNLRVFVLNEKQINGLVTPNGKIYITQGFINQYKLGKVSGAELTSVIAHELGHLALGHTKKRLITFSAISAISMVISTILSRLLPYVGAIIGRYLSQVLISGLSRKDEFEADSYAAALLIRSGIGTAPQISLLKKLEQLTGIVSSNVTWTLSHPSPEQRINAIQNLEASWMTGIKDQN